MGEETAPLTAGAAAESRRRAVWVDAARCIAMFFIIWLHTGKSPAWNGELVGGSLCLFFTFAGYFMPRQAGACARRALRMLWLWVLWSLLSAGLYMLTKAGAEWSWERLAGWGVGAYNTPLWFLRNLAVFQLLAAGMLALRLLPRHAWLTVALLASFSYTCEYSQHVTLRFDWMVAFMLGCALRSSVDLAHLSHWLSENTVLLLAAVSLLLVQIHALPAVGTALDMAVKTCSLPVESLAYTILYSLTAMALVRRLPRVAAALALSGRSMLFCYITHSFALAPFYNYPDLVFACNVWVPILLLALLTGLYTLLNRRFPRAMHFLFAC